MILLNEILTFKPLKSNIYCTDYLSVIDEHKQSSWNEVICKISVKYVFATFNQICIRIMKY